VRGSSRQRLHRRLFRAEADSIIGSLSRTVGLFIAAVIVNGTKDRMDMSCYAIPIGLQFIWVASACRFTSSRFEVLFRFA
jgi:hypothetical protein